MRPSLLFGGVLVLSLALKLVAAREEPPPDQALFARATESFLVGQGFTARAGQRGFGVFVRGARGDCRLELRDYEPHGTYAVLFAKLARRIGPLHFVYRGAISREAPKFIPLTEYFIGRELRRAGIAAPRAPILAVAATPECDLASLPWRALATLPR